MCSDIVLALILLLIVSLIFLTYIQCKQTNTQKINGLTKKAKEKVEDLIKDVVDKLPEEKIQSSFENNEEPETQFLGGAEPFNNDLPNEKVKLDENTQYDELIQTMALDKSVQEQHKNYVSDRNRVTNTASFQPSRSDTQDVVPFIGLRRPQYSVNGKDLVDNTARTVPTELDADRLAKPTKIFWK